jgi:HK97 family phage major capsid protein
LKKTPESLRTEAKQLHDQAASLWKRHDSDGQEHTPAELTEFDDITKRSKAALDQAKSIEDREATLNALDAAGSDSAGRTSVPLPHNDERNTHRGRHGYSLLKALRQIDPLAKGERLDGIELETQQELLKRRHAGGHEVQGVIMPWDLPVDIGMARSFANRNGLERRDLTTTTGAGAVMTVTLPTMIELLRNLSLMNALGAKTLSDMVGNFNLPRQSGAATSYWINPESATITASTQTVNAVAYAPKTIGAQTTYSRSFLHQTSVDAEMFVRTDHALVLAIGLDQAGLAGSGSGATPTGIVNDANANVIAIGTNGGPPTWAIIAQLEQGVDVANALNGSLNFVTSPQGRYKLKTTVKDSNTAAKYLWNEDFNSVNGYPAWSTNQIPSNLTKGTGTGLTVGVFGDFMQLVFALWGGMDTIVNPYTGSASGAVQITMLQDADVHCRHDNAFSVCKDINPV